MRSEFSLPELFVSAPFTAVFEALEKGFGNVYARRFSVTSVHEVGVILREQYFFRVNSNVAITILLETLDIEKTKKKLFQVLEELAGWRFRMMLMELLFWT